ncbi:MAG: nicotinate-nucleotide diphosphorylase (carboxylating) [Gammaproteobacteria bacterium]|nr:nicotinate-nucleotide diphosphorylase (carboxylating) [Gammaproteobacteria bacterium]
MQIKPPSDVDKIANTALSEDIGSGDITALLIDSKAEATAEIIVKETGIICGIPYAESAFRQLQSQNFLSLEWLFNDGDEVAQGQTLARIRGNARQIVSGERTALNFLQTLSGTATKSHYFSNLIKHTATQILDTRKTLPGLRNAQKYAVRVGGCCNHRQGLYDAFLIKENHIAACGGIESAIAKAKTLDPNKTIEIEVQNINELTQVLNSEADTVMLDNFDLSAIKEAVRLNDGQLSLEVSGNIDETSLITIAEVGVDYISVGGLTKNIQALDLSLLFFNK